MRTSDGRCGKARVRLEPGQTGTVEIPVGELGRVTGRLIQAPGVPRSGWVHVDLNTPQERETFASKDGLFEVLALEPGAHVLYLGGQRKTSFTLGEGEALGLGRPGAAQHTQRTGGALRGFDAVIRLLHVWRCSCAFRRSGTREFVASRGWVVSHCYWA